MHGEWGRTKKENEGSVGRGIWRDKQEKSAWKKSTKADQTYT